MHKLTPCNRCEQATLIDTLNVHTDKLYGICTQGSEKIMDLVAEFIGSRTNPELGGDTNNAEPTELDLTAADALARIIPWTVELSSIEVELDELIVAANSLDCSINPNMTCPRAGFVVDSLRHITTKGEVIGLNLMMQPNK
jgi:hypothetical protein